MGSRNLIRFTLLAALLVGIAAVAFHHEQFSVVALQDWVRKQAPCKARLC